MVEAVTQERIYKALGDMFKRSKATLVIMGGNVHDVPTKDVFERTLSQ